MALLASVHVQAVSPGNEFPGQFSLVRFQSLEAGSLSDTQSKGLSEILGASATPADDSGIQIAAEPAGGETPEPATFLLLGGALVGLGVIRRRKRRTEK